MRLRKGPYEAQRWETLGENGLGVASAAAALPSALRRIVYDRAIRPQGPYESRDVEADRASAHRNAGDLLELFERLQQDASRLLGLSAGRREIGIIIHLVSNHLSARLVPGGVGKHVVDRNEPAFEARLRRNLGRDDMKLLFNFSAEFARSLDVQWIELRAKSDQFSSFGDATLVSGPITGQPANQSDLREVCETSHDVPVFANTCVRIDNVADVLSIAQDVIGTHFKVNGNASNAVDANRVKRFMDQVVTLH